jgi:peptidoglycan hydrolase-like protein with peptidoglycan-binding domain
VRTIQEIEAGKQAPRRYTVDKLADALAAAARERSFPGAEDREAFLADVAAFRAQASRGAARPRAEPRLGDRPGAKPSRAPGARVVALLLAALLLVLGAGLAGWALGLRPGPDPPAGATAAGSVPGDHATGEGASGPLRGGGPGALGGTPPPAPGFPRLAIGARGPEVRTVQLLLRYRRYDVADDGVFGPVTQRALRDFQAKQGLEPDGAAEAGTWERLVVTVGEGSRGEPVTAVQVLLSQKHGARLDADGDFGPRTRAAVLRFQAQAGLPPDGVVGPLTWRHLVGP